MQFSGIGYKQLTSAFLEEATGGTGVEAQVADEALGLLSSIMV